MLYELGIMLYTHYYAYMQTIKHSISEMPGYVQPMPNHFGICEKGYVHHICFEICEKGYVHLIHFEICKKVSAWICCSRLL